MLLVVQFPLADARKFLEDSALIGPAWPLPTPNFDFVRYFGAIRYRNLGGLSGWVGEDLICRADRALTVLQQSSPLGGFLLKSRLAFRRFYFDGWAVGKFEIGIQIRNHQFPTLIDLAEYFLRIPTRVRSSLGKPVDSPLIQAGKHLAHLYLTASTPTSKALSEKESWQVRAGTPILCLELNNRDKYTIPKEAKPISLPDWASDLKLFHYGIPYQGGKVFMWILQVGNSIKDESITRALRLYLLRLNAEHECLRLILQHVEKKRIQVSRGTDASEDLQMYLAKAFKRIARFEAKTGDVNQEIAELARQSINTISPGQLDALLDAVKDYRRYLRKVIEEYAKQDTKIYYFIGNKEVNVDNSQDEFIFTGANIGIVNIKNKMDNVTQMVGNVASMDSSSRQELEQLMKELSTALKDVPQEKAEDAEAVADAAQDVVDNLSKEKPNKSTLQIKLSGLKMAAENIAKVLPTVLPIAMKISEVVAKSLGIG